MSNIHYIINFSQYSGKKSEFQSKLVNEKKIIIAWCRNQNVHLHNLFAWCFLLNCLDLCSAEDGTKTYTSPALMLRKSCCSQASCSPSPSPCSSITLFDINALFLLRIYFILQNWDPAKTTNTQTNSKNTYFFIRNLSNNLLKSCLIQITQIFYTRLNTNRFLFYPSWLTQHLLIKSFSSLRYETPKLFVCTFENCNLKSSNHRT